MLAPVAIAESLPTRQTSPTLHPRLDEDTARNVPVQPARILTTLTTSITRPADPKRTSVHPAMATSQKATNPTGDAETETRTTTIVIAMTSLAVTEIVIVTGTESVDIAMKDMTTDTTTCSTASPVVTPATMIGIATGGAAMMMMTATAIVAGAVEMQPNLGSLDSPSGRGRPWACSRITRSLSSRKRVPSTCRSRWRMALEGVEDCETTFT